MTFYREFILELEPNKIRVVLNLVGSIGGSMKMPPNIIKRWVLEYDKWNNRNYWLSGGVFSVPPVWLMKNGIWSNVGTWLRDGIWRMNKTLFSTNNIWNNDFVWTKDLIWKL